MCPDGRPPTPVPGRFSAGTYRVARREGATGPAARRGGAAEGGGTTAQVCGDRRGAGAVDAGERLSAHGLREPRRRGRGSAGAARPRRGRRGEAGSPGGGAIGGGQGPV